MWRIRIDAPPSPFISSYVLFDLLLYKSIRMRVDDAVIVRVVDAKGNETKTQKTYCLFTQHLLVFPFI